MRRPGGPGVSRHLTIAVEGVQNWLFDFDSGVRRLGVAELSRYANRRPYIGWRIDVRHQTRVEQLDLVLDASFPRTPPRIAMVAMRPDGPIPHVEKDGVLCLYPPGTLFSPDSPTALVQNAICTAMEIIEHAQSGGLDDDFRNEFLSYWILYANPHPPPIRSLLERRPESRVVHVRCGSPFFLVGENDETLVRWLVHRHNGMESSTFKAEAAVLLWLEAALIPNEYPRSAMDVYKLAQRAGPHGSELLVGRVQASPERVVVALGFATARGPCFAATILGPPPVSTILPHGRADPLTRGFRPGRVPAGVRVHRYFGHQKIHCARVDRMDAGWVHGRDEDPRFQRLRDKRVAVPIALTRSDPPLPR